MEQGWLAIDVFLVKVEFELGHEEGQVVKEDGALELLVGEKAVEEGEFLGVCAKAVEELG